MSRDLDLARADLARDVLRWLSELDDSNLSSIAGKPLTVKVSVSIAAGELELAGLDVERGLLTTRKETRRVTSGSREPVVRSLADFVDPADLARLDKILANDWKFHD